MSSATIPTLHSPKRVALKRGGHVLIRRATRSQRDKLLRVAEVREGDAGSLALFCQLAFRWGVVGVEGVTMENPETGEPVKYHRTGYAGLGNIATEDVYNAIDDEDDLAKIIGEIVPQGEDGGALSEEQLGNS